MKTLIVYYSWTRNNEILANALQKRLHCDMLKLEEVKKRNSFSIVLDLIFNRTSNLRHYSQDIRDYQHCILISPIWAGKIATPLKSFIKKEKAHIKDYSFISVCGGGDPSQKEKIVRELSVMLMGPPVAFSELSVNNLLPDDKKNTIKYTSGYRITDGDLTKFEARINDFVKHFKIEDQKTHRYTYSAAR